MSCAVSWDYIDANPVKQFSKRHIRESPPRTTYPTAEQVDRLVANARPMTGRIIRFLAETGMRQEEVCSLEWSQVSIPRREVRLTKTKTSSPRVVPLSDAALGTLVGTPRQITSPYVFWHADGIDTRTSPTASPWSHDEPECRSGATTCATPSPARFLQATGNIPALQAILGHRSIADDHAVRPHGHEPSPPGDGRLRHKNRHNRDGIVRNCGRRHSPKTLK